MQTIGKALGTGFVWAAIAGLSYLFNSFGILDGKGATGLVIAGFLLTAWIWMD